MLAANLVILEAPDGTLVETVQIDENIYSVPWLFPTSRMNGTWQVVGTGISWTMNINEVYTRERWLSLFASEEGDNA